jgi:hypothetical protein
LDIAGCSVEFFQSKLVLKLDWPDLVWLLLTRGGCSEVAVNTGLTVLANGAILANTNIGDQVSKKLVSFVSIQVLEFFLIGNKTIMLVTGLTTEWLWLQILSLYTDSCKQCYLYYK